jgi:hypothetical protein
MKDMIRIGDFVMVRGAWGTEAPTRVQVHGMELCAAPRQKYGVPVQEVPATLKDYINFTLSNGRWAYGYQIDLIEADSEQNRKSRESSDGLRPLAS